MHNVKTLATPETTSQANARIEFLYWKPNEKRLEGDVEIGNLIAEVPEVPEVPATETTPLIPAVPAVPEHMEDTKKRHFDIVGADYDSLMDAMGSATVAIGLDLEGRVFAHLKAKGILDVA